VNSCRLPLEHPHLEPLHLEELHRLEGHLLVWLLELHHLEELLLELHRLEELPLELRHLEDHLLEDRRLEDHLPVGRLLEDRRLEGQRGGLKVDLHLEELLRLGLVQEVLRKVLQMAFQQLEDLHRPQLRLQYQTLPPVCGDSLIVLCQSHRKLQQLTSVAHLTRLLDELPRVDADKVLQA
jgi:hypothetical protein